MSSCLPVTRLLLLTAGLLLSGAPLMARVAPIQEAHTGPGKPADAKATRLRPGNESAPTDKLTAPPPKTTTDALKERLLARMKATRMKPVRS